MPDPSTLSSSRTPPEHTPTDDSPWPAPYSALAERARALGWDGSGSLWGLGKWAGTWKEMRSSECAGPEWRRGVGLALLKIEGEVRRREIWRRHTHCCQLRHDGTRWYHAAGCSAGKPRRHYLLLLAPLLCALCPFHVLGYVLAALGAGRWLLAAMQVEGVHWLADAIWVAFGLFVVGALVYFERRHHARHRCEHDHRTTIQTNNHASGDIAGGDIHKE